MSLETNFDPSFASALALREKQIQQNYRPLIGIHKWFARRPGTLFRCLLLAELGGGEPIASSFWHAHELSGVVGDPFLGGGTTAFEANRLGLGVVGSDINPMAHWIVTQGLALIDLKKFRAAAETVITSVEQQIGDLYRTECGQCGREAHAKYFLWVKTELCPHCAAPNDLFPGYLLAEATRHPKNVLLCSSCGHLNEYDSVPTRLAPEVCKACGTKVSVEGPARRQRIQCHSCKEDFGFPTRGASQTAPNHRMWAIEYHCETCKPDHDGRFFKTPDKVDLARFATACDRLAAAPDLPIPGDEIPSGDESSRLHRWGYRRYREMFSERQLFGLGLLLREILALSGRSEREALLTVFSDFLRYQNMLCRYDTYALKCQDIFSVHGFPVGLVQCENNLLGFPRVGTGGFRHFVEKYQRAKDYCEHPFETRNEAGRKTKVSVEGETITASFATSAADACRPRGVWIEAASSEAVDLSGVQLDAVFTDPPYFDNVQYAELMDFCFVWLKLGLAGDHKAFRRTSTRNSGELTGNASMARGLEEFALGLSRVFRHYATALKPGAPFVFTYHHNDALAYLPIIIAVLDAGLGCTATLPAAAEMGASLHISGTGSSVLDSVFVCRKGVESSGSRYTDMATRLDEDIAAMEAAGVRVSQGDCRCLIAGHLAGAAIQSLAPTWRADLPIAAKFASARELVAELQASIDFTMASGALRLASKPRTTRGGRSIVTASV